MALAALAGTAEAASLRIVAIGASNTSGWGVGAAKAYPARLEALLKARGIDAEVINAGVPFETTNGMLARIDHDVPDGTRIVVVDPGGNDLRFLGTAARRTANLEAMTARVRARGMEPIVYDPVFPREHYQWDLIHLNAAGHAAVAEDLLPAILDRLGRGRRANAPPVRPRGSGP